MPSKISKYLKHTEGCALKDCTTFNMWMESEISDEECYELFIKHNKIRKPEFTIEEFIEWLNSLGYRKVKINAK